MHGLKLAVDDFVEEADEVGGVEGRFQHDHFVHQTAQGPHVRLETVRDVLAQFGAEVARGSYAGGRLVQRVVEVFGDSEVSQLDRVISVVIKISIIFSYTKVKP